MQESNRHLTDAELLWGSDGELPSQRASKLREHLAECESCRVRLVQIENAMSTASHAYRDSLDSSLTPEDVSRARLRLRLSAEGGARQASWLGDLAAFVRAPAWAYVAGVLVLGATWLALRYQPIGSASQGEVGSAHGAAPLVPDANLTPGAVGAVTISQICAADEPAERRPPLSVQRAVFHEYGMDGAPAQEYEVDHLITPALGGTDDIRNLWPESYRPEWNAHVKDELEDRLHALVCQGRLDLPTAQHEMATNWITAYKKYFHTDKPLLHNSGVVADQKKSPDS
ncbi:MAG TPA: zf-HC2 domain-containing protein [Candidatus Acidoferrales bacterium]|nr:zf-HC2 domain-containing protein [Candidatus Acidoferrales bacterium]